MWLHMFRFLSTHACTYVCMYICMVVVGKVRTRPLRVRALEECMVDGACIFEDLEIS